MNASRLEEMYVICGRDECNYFGWSHPTNRIDFMRKIAFLDAHSQREIHEENKWTREILCVCVRERESESVRRREETKVKREKRKQEAQKKQHRSTETQWPDCSRHAGGNKTCSNYWCSWGWVWWSQSCPLPTPHWWLHLCSPRAAPNPDMPHPQWQRCAAATLQYACFDTAQKKMRQKNGRGEQTIRRRRYRQTNINHKQTNRQTETQKKDRQLNKNRDEQTGRAYGASSRKLKRPSRKAEFKSQDRQRLALSSHSNPTCFDVSNSRTRQPWWGEGEQWFEILMLFVAGSVGRFWLRWIRIHRLQMNITHFLSWNRCVAS